MYYSATAHVPVYYDLYRRRIPEKTCLEIMMTKAKDLGFSDVCFVMAPGIEEVDNLRDMLAVNHCFGIGYIAALPGGSFWAEKLIDENKADICKAENWIREHEVCGIKRNTNLEGIHVAVHIFFDPAERLQVELEKMGHAECLLKKYVAYYETDEKQKTPFIFEAGDDTEDKKFERKFFSFY